MNIRSDIWLAAPLAVEAEAAFSTTDGGQLVFGRGLSRVAVQYCELVPGLVTLTEQVKGVPPLEMPSSGYDEDAIRCRVRVIDNHGNAFTAERDILASWLFELVRWPHLVARRSEAQPLLMNVRCIYQRNMRVPAVGADGRPVLYMGKHLAFFDILTERVVDNDYLVLRVHPTRGGALGGDAPEVWTSTWWTAQFVITPGVLAGRYSPTIPPLIFARERSSGVPEPNVFVR